MSNPLEVLTSSKYDLEDLLHEEQDLFENLLLNDPNNRAKIADTLDRIEALSKRISTLDHQISLLPEQVEGEGEENQEASEEDSGQDEHEDEENMPPLVPVNVAANLLQFNNNNLLQNLANIFAAAGLQPVNGAGAGLQPGAGAGAVGAVPLPPPNMNLNLNDFLVNHLNNHNHFDNLNFQMNQQVIVENEIVENQEGQNEEIDDNESDNEIDGEHHEENGELGAIAGLGPAMPMVFTVPLNGGNANGIVAAIQQMMGLIAQNQGDREYEMFSNLENVNVPCKDEVIAKMLPIKYSEVEEKHKKDRNIQCSICLSEYEKDDLVTLLKCDHIYHIDCINNWIKNNSKCPVCKYDLNQIDIHELD
jgi:hypothetical protein